jgi:mRNA-degrading endonuclease RelE of RelBE toxin-antitoxin system
MYKLILSPRAQKELKKLKKIDESPIKLVFEELKENPLIGKRLGRKLTNRYSYRFRAYRIIYKVNHKDQVINVLTAGHRSKVYD